MSQDNFKENFLEIEQKLFKKKQSKNKRLWGLFFGVFLFLAVITCIFLQRDDTLPTINKKIKQEPVLFWQLNLVNKDLEGWLKKDQNRQNLLNLIYQQLQEKLGLGAENLFKQEVFLIKNNHGEVFFKAKIQDPAKTKEILDNLKKPGSISRDYGYLDHKIYNLSLKSEISNLTFNSQEIFYSFLDNNLVITSNLEAMKKIIEPGIELIFPGQSFITKIIEDPFSKFYVNSASISPIEDKIGAFMKNSTFLILKSKVQKERLVFDLDGQGLSDKKIQTEASDDWLTYVPKEEVLLVFGSAIGQLKENQYFEKLAQKWQDLYFFNSATDFDFLSGRFLVVLVPKNGIFSLDGANFDYLAIFENINNLNWDSEEILKIEQAVKQILSYRFPEEIKVKLPDNSPATEYVANPDIFSFESKDFANFSLKYIRKPNFEFAYSTNVKRIFLSNSLNLLESSLINSQIINANQGFGVKEKLSDCFKAEDKNGDFIYFNLGRGFLSQFGIQKAVISQEKACIY